MAGRGLNVKIEGIEQMVAALHRGEREIYNVLMDALAGEGGQAIAEEARSRVHSHSGRVASGIDVRGHGRVVEVGYDKGTDYVGTWLESGTDAHYINPKSRRMNAKQGKTFRHGRVGLHLRNGQFRSHVLHPGTRPQRIMSKSLRAARPTVEAAIIREFEKRGVAQP